MYLSEITLLEIKLLSDELACLMLSTQTKINYALEIT